MARKAQSDPIQQMLDAAKKSFKNAYAPYSGFPVGAAALFDDGKIYSGGNVENASYGLSMCAERVAMSAGIVNGHKLMLSLMIYTRKQAAFPCGACRQWMAEFSTDCRIYIATDKRIITTNIRLLLPKAFWL